MRIVPQNCIHGVKMFGQSCAKCTELSTDTHRTGRFIAARDGMEAQRGMNDIFPGDPVWILTEGASN
jgi:hypothetical protein